MAKKKKGNGLKQFEISYTRLNPLQIFIANIEAVDKYIATMKFKEKYPGARIKEIKEIQPTPPVEENVADQN